MPRFKVRDFSKALILDGSDDYVELVGYTPPVTAFTVAFWVWVGERAANDRIFDWQDSGPEDGFTFIIGGTLNDRIGMVIRNGASSAANVLTNQILKGRWTFITGTYEVNSAKIYQDAVLKASDTSVTMTEAAATPRIGGRTTGGSLFRGMIDDLMIFNTVLDLTAIEDLYYKYKIPSGLQVHLKFNDDVTDSSGNGNDGTASGSPAYSANVKFGTRTVVT